MKKETFSSPLKMIPSTERCLYSFHILINVKMRACGTTHGVLSTFGMDKNNEKIFLAGFTLAVLFAVAVLINYLRV